MSKFRLFRADTLRGGFTLLELLIATAITGMLVVGLMTIANQTGKIWIYGQSQIEKRRNARSFLRFISSDLENAVIPCERNFRSSGSNLRFIVVPKGVTLSPGIFFDDTISNHDVICWQATNASNPGLGEIAEVGYFVRYQVLSGKPQFHLCRYFVNATLLDNSENPDFLVYNQDDASAWVGGAVINQYTNLNAPEYVGLFAENVIGFWVQCLDPLGKPITRTAAYTLADGSTIASSGYIGHSYDSNQGYRYTGSDTKDVDVMPPALPASVEITVVFLDSHAAGRLSDADVVAIQGLYAGVNSSADVCNFIQKLPLSIRAAARPISTMIYFR